MEDNRRTLVLKFLHRNKPQRAGIDRVAQTGGRGPVREDMPEM